MVETVGEIKQLAKNSSSDWEKNTPKRADAFWRVQRTDFNDFFFVQKKKSSGAFNFSVFWISYEHVGKLKFKKIVKFRNRADSLLTKRILSGSSKIRRTRRILTHEEVYGPAVTWTAAAATSAATATNDATTDSAMGGARKIRSADEEDGSRAVGSFRCRVTRNHEVRRDASRNSSGRSVGRVVGARTRRTSGADLAWRDGRDGADHGRTRDRRRRRYVCPIRRSRGPLNIWRAARAIIRPEKWRARTKRRSLERGDRVWGCRPQ